MKLWQIREGVYINPETIIWLRIISEKGIIYIKVNYTNLNIDVDYTIKKQDNEEIFNHLLNLIKGVTE